IDPTIITTGKTVALTMLDLLRSPQKLAAARAEFDTRRAANPIEPLLPRDFEPPIGLPWPAYVSDPHDQTGRWVPDMNV
ncbi:MAG: hypothetical protein RR600_08590, partial [Aurantimicrobium sp.]